MANGHTLRLSKGKFLFTLSAYVFLLEMELVGDEVKDIRRSIVVMRLHTLQYIGPQPINMFSFTVATCSVFIAASLRTNTSRLQMKKFLNKIDSPVGRNLND